MAELQPQSAAQPLQQQPVLVYPNTQTKQPSSIHPNDSFGTVFIVLAVIIVVSALACFLGRICNRRISGQKPKQNVHNRNVRPIGRDPDLHPKEGDIEFGFDKRIAASKPVGNGGSKHTKPQEYGGKRRHESKQGDDHGEHKASG